MIRHHFYNFYSTFCLVFALLCFANIAHAQTISSPQSVLGFHPTTDKTIADWRQITGYFQKLDRESERVEVREIGKTTLGKPFIVAFISASENIKNLENYKRTNQKLADPRQIRDDAELKKLIGQGKTVVAISCSIHSTEIVASQMSMNLAYELATATDEETKEILQNTILLLIPSANPDGIDIVANWYRKTLGTPFEGSSPTELYHHYAGHDNNRDWFMLNLPETRLVTKLFWQEWFPQVVYDVHQMGQNGARFVIPPFFDPPNPNIPPLILREVGLMGYKIAADLQAARFAGVATNTTFDTWWHGGFRSAPYYHNSIGILSEAASANLMSPVVITREKMQQTRGARGLASPLETATNHPQVWQPQKWSAGDIAAMERLACRSVLQMAAKFRRDYLRNFYELNRVNSQENSNANQPTAYVILAGQGREEIVSRFVEILLAQGVEVYRMTRELHASIPSMQRGETEIPLGSFLVPLDQPQRNNVEALFGKQTYPNRVDERGNVDPPYDVAGWTLPLQMGIESYAVARIAESSNERELERLTDINQVRQNLNLKTAKEAFAKLPNPLRSNPRVGLYKGFTASMDEGWTRFVFDTFQVPFQTVTDADVRAGNINYDAIILPADSENTIVNGLKAENYPKEYAGGITEQGVENLKKYVENGGKLICFDDSCEMVIKTFNLPMKNVLKDLKRSEFYCPGSILQLDVDRTNPLTKSFGKQTAAYFINSSAFEIADVNKVKSVATYANSNALLSGWLLGEKYLNGKTALAETVYGRGKIVLFAFRPQHRGQTFGTFPFIFNALEK